MPIYTIQDPNTGRTVKIEGDSPPTEQELEQIFANLGEQQAPAQEATQAQEQMPVEQQPETSMFNSIMNNYLGNIEGSATIASSIPANIVAGIAGLNEAINPFNEEFAGGKQVENIQNMLTYAPRSKQGKESLRQLGDLFSFIADAEEYVGESAMQSADILGVENPNIRGAFGAGGVTALNAIPELLGLRGYQAARVVNASTKTGSPVIGAAAKLDPGMADDMAKVLDDAFDEFPQDLRQQKIAAMQTPTKKAIAEQIIKGQSDSNLAKYMVSEKGRVLGDPLAKSAISKGFDPGVIQPAKASSKSDKLKLLKMIQEKRKVMGNRLYGQENRPHDVAGQSVVDRIKFIKGENIKAANKINEVANNQLKGAQISSPKIAESFSNIADQFGVGISRADDGKLKIDWTDFSGSPGDRKPFAEVLRQMDRLYRQGKGDAFAAHELKKIIDRNVDYGSKAKASDDMQNALKSFRKDINDTLKDQFPDYAAANEKYSESVNLLNTWQDLVGRKNSIDGERAGSNIGTILNRMDSNAGSTRDRIISAVKDLQELSLKYGGKFDDSPGLQIMFANELDRVLGTSARTSIEGRISAGTESAITQGPISAAKSYAGKKTGEAIEAIIGPSDEKALKALEDLIKRDLKK